MTETPANQKSPDCKLKKYKMARPIKIFFYLRSSEEKLKDPYANFMHQ
jgi:hypothetical protein